MQKNIKPIALFFLLALVIWQCKKDEPAPPIVFTPPVVVTPPVTVELPPISPYVRGVWLTNVASQVFYSPEGIKAAVKKCRESGINHIFAVMWNKGRTLYPSKVMQDNFGIPIEEALKGRDPLRELLDAAHADSIKVYAWMEFGFAAENSGLGEHILRLRPQWAALGQDGKVVTKNNFKWMNALDRDVQDFMMSLLTEVVTQYPDLDGIQGDDRLPALPSECGYNPDVIAQYKRDNNGIEPTNPKTDTTWINWRTNKLNQFAKRMFTELKTIRPAIKISMAPSVYPFSKTEYLQDWPTWVREGWVDMISPQLYRYDLASYNNELAKLFTQIPADKQNMIVPGILLKLGSYKPADSFLQAMIDENRLKKINGETFFFYEGLSENTAFFQKYSRK
jgi:uncharacterized lipoprotein YddW (UPF0748 family)